MAEPGALEVGSRHDLRARRSPNAPETAGYQGGDQAHGWVHSYETGSTVDGPGIRVTPVSYTHLTLPTIYSV